VPDPTICTCSLSTSPLVVAVVTTPLLTPVITPVMRKAVHQPPLGVVMPLPPTNWKEVGVTAVIDQKPSRPGAPDPAICTCSLSTSPLAVAVVTTPLLTPVITPVMVRSTLVSRVGTLGPGVQVLALGSKVSVVLVKGSGVEYSPPTMKTLPVVNI